jgi:triacylglycerol esterase/lipase EstA (alpha/beta hydrolase family)
MAGWRGLSRQRKRLVAAVAGLAVVIAVVSTVLATAGSGAAPPSGYPAQDRPGPVLLLPGYGGSTAAVSVLAARIRATGRSAIVVRLPGNGTESLLLDAAALNAAVQRALRAGAPSVDVIGYSAGGVAALLWARDDDGAHEARRVITLGSPFHGTRLAAAGQAFVPGACPTACQQLTPGSTLLAKLDAAGMIRRPRWLSLWTIDDKVVTPPDSARLPGAINVPVQSICPAVRVTHSELPTNPVITAIVLQAIGRGPLRYPTAAVCGG